ncbi:MAG: polyprenyl synthetase family protein [Bacteroidales bacterium]|nr:polyprenyl synthetase family protein [Bacteroidales bacterium]
MELPIQCIEAEFKQFRLAFEQELCTQVPLADQVIHYFLDRRGKQLRPILTLLTAKMVAGEVTSNSILGAVAVELLHNASLMHDDVVDSSDQRRGTATINYVWDNRVAVLTGDFFLARCLICCSKTGSLEIIRALSEMTSILSEGELEQISNARAHLLSEDAYFSVIRGKTASLFSACLRIGGLSVNATPEQIEALSEIGYKIGMVFQIRDDIFDYFPSNDAVGKPTGHDIMEGKVTLPLLYALQHAPATQSQVVMDLLKANRALTEDEIARIVDFAKQMGGIEYAQARMKNIAFEAKELLSTFPDNACRGSLMQLVDYFIDRNG